MNQPNLEQCRNDAREAALLAWKEIESFFQGDFEVFEKEGDGPATEADIRADHFIVDYLRARYPETEYGYLSEETQHGNERLGKKYCWIIDPIDGTREFIQGKDDFAVHIGLAGRIGEDGPSVPLVGVVYEPRAGWLYSSAHQLGAWGENLNTGEKVPLAVSDQTDLAKSRVVITSQKYGTRLQRALDRLNPIDIHRRGSFGVKTLQVVCRKAEIYLNTARRQSKEWDTLAPHAVLNEAGGRMTNLEGQEITYNKEDYYVEMGTIASNKALHELALKTLGDVSDWWDS